MSNAFPAARLFQKLMIALDPSAKNVGLSQALTGNAKVALIADYTALKYPGYTLASFKEMLDQVTDVHINGGTYTFGGTATLAAPTAASGGIYIHGQENFNKLTVAGSQLSLYIRPTP
jgi:hypothetical protein